MCISLSLCGIVISAHGNGKDKTETMFSLHFQFIHCWQGMFTITCGSVDINHQHTHVSCICTLALFLPVHTISAAGCMLATSIYPVSQSTFCLEDLTCIAKYSVRCYQIVCAVGRIPHRPGVLASDIRHTLISPDITETFHRTNPEH